ncbi:MAG: ribosomal RNA small subunit methyltransferase A [Clostridia bacterium]|nr:ribosomal RNA small subunit methyltransferase A [Clostridia bacterium]
MSIASIKAQLAQYGLTPNKALGQNFLADDGAAEEIAASCMGPVIEIGPGMGALTEKLLNREEQVAAVEIDRRMAEILRDRFGDRLLLTEGDVLKTDIRAIADSLGGQVSIAGNLPYYITTPICTQLITCGADIRSMTLMMQKEAAERFFAKPGDRVYGPLTVLAQYYYDVSTLLKLSKEAYYPQPEVDSVVLKLTRKDAEPHPMLHWLLESAFAMRRKTLSNNLKAAGVSDRRLNEICDAVGIQPNIRAEKLTPAQFAAISGEIEMHGK